MKSKKKMVQMNLLKNKNRVRYRKRAYGNLGEGGGGHKLGDWDRHTCMRMNQLCLTLFSPMAHYCIENR